LRARLLTQDLIMLTIVSGNALGVNSNSFMPRQGDVGSNVLGKGGDRAYINGVTGNLVIQRQDELISDIGKDIGVLRTYNSLGELNDDNSDNWKIGFYRGLRNLQGTISSAGSSIEKIEADGAITVYRYDAIKQAYVNSRRLDTDDKLIFDATSGLFSWIDGKSACTESYSWSGVSGKIESSADSEGRTTQFVYSGDLLREVKGASGDVVHLDYSGVLLQQVRTVQKDGQTSILTRYEYDSANRLKKVITDLSPGDGVIGDGNVYVTSYAYDGDSTRIASVVQSDGSAYHFSYAEINSKFRVIESTQLIGATPAITRYSYADNGLSAYEYSVNVNPDALIVSEVVEPYVIVPEGMTWQQLAQTIYKLVGSSHIDGAAVALREAVNGQEAPVAGAKIAPPATLEYQVAANLNEGYLSDITEDRSITRSLDLSKISNTIFEAREAALSPAVLNMPGWSGAQAIEGLGQAASGQQVRFDSQGNVHVAWTQNNNVYYKRYDQLSGTWGGVQILDGSIAGTPSKLSIAVSGSGNLLFTWIQGNSIYARRSIQGVLDTASNAIPILENLAGAAYNPVGAINDLGHSAVAFVQNDGAKNNVYANLNFGSGWQAAATVIDDIGSTNDNTVATSVVPNLSMDAGSNVSLTWHQKTGSQTGDSLYSARYEHGGIGWMAPLDNAFENAATAVSQSRVLYDNEGNGVAIWLQGSSLFSKTFSAATGAWGSAALLSSSASGVPSFSYSSNGKGIAAWLESGSVYARRYEGGAWVAGSKELLESSVQIARNPVAVINESGQAAVVYNQIDDYSINSVFSVQYSQVDGWTQAVQVESSASAIGTAVTDAPSVGMDKFGNIQVFWLQKAEGESVNSLYGARFDAEAEPYYIVNAGASWEDVSLALYGTIDSAQTLRALMNDVGLVAGLKIRNPPGSISYSGNFASAPHYLIPPGSTWGSIALDLYGSADFADLLEGAMGGGEVLEGARIYGLPDTLVRPDSVTYKGYTVSDPSQMDWGVLAQMLYGDASLATRLSQALGNPVLQVGVVLAGLPASFNFGGNGVAHSKIAHTVQEGASWSSVALSVYGDGSVAAAAALKGLMKNPELVAGDSINLPISLSYLRGGELKTLHAAEPYIYSTRVVDPYFLVGVADTWEKIAVQLYGSSARGLIESLKALNGDIALESGMSIRAPSSLKYAAAAPVEALNTKMTVSDDAGGEKTYKYDVYGRLIEISEKISNGEAFLQSYYYDATDRLVRIESGDLKRIFEYDASGNIVRESDGFGYSIERIYGAQNQLLSETRREKSSDMLQNGVSHHKQYIYDDQHVTRLRYVVGESGEVTAYEYDVMGLNSARLQFQVPIQRPLLGQDVTLLSLGEMITWSAGQLISSVKRTEFEYDFRGQISSETVFSSLDAQGRGVIDGTESTTRYVYDHRGLLIQTIAPQGQISETTYDGLGRVLLSKNALGQSEVFLYSDAGAKTVVTHRNGLVETLAYDNAGRVIEVRWNDSTSSLLSRNRSHYDLRGNIVLSEDAGGSRRWSFYDLGGRKIAGVDPDGTVTEYQYDGNGRVVRQVVYAEHAATNSWLDDSGNLAMPDFSDVRPLQSSGDRINWFVYDASGREVYEINALGQVTESIYDAFSRKTGRAAFGRVIDVSLLGDRPSVNQVRQLLWLPPVDAAIYQAPIPRVNSPIADTVAISGAAFSIRIPDGVFNQADIIGGVSFSASRFDSSDLPAWLKFNASTQTFYGYPSPGDVGEMDLKVSMTSVLTNITVSQRVHLSVIFGGAGVGEDPQPIAETVIFPGNVSLLEINPVERIMPVKVALTDSVLPRDILLVRDGYDLIVKVRGFNSQIVSKYFFGAQAEGNGVSELRFASGTIWSYHQLADIAMAGTGLNDVLIGMPADDRLAGFEGNDRIQGGGGNDTLDGGAGADELLGGEGSDTYHFGRGYGQDVIYNEAYYEDPASKTDVVKMLGLNPQDVVMTRVPQARWWGGSGAQGDADDLLIRVKGTNDSLRIANFFYDDAAGPYGQAVDRFDFANGQSWSIADVKLAVRAQTNLDDRLVGYAGNDSIEGLQGDDTIYGRGGDDVLDGGLGNDTVEGGDGVDVVRGGAGDDALAGDAGDDALHGGTGKDTLVGGVGDDTLSGDEGNDVLTGGEGNDVLIGGAGDDSLEGGTGSDTYHFGRGSGHDVIYNEAYYEDPASKTDVVKMLGLNPQDVVMTRVPPARWWGALSQDDLLIQIKGTSDSLRIANFFIADSSYGHAIARFDFANGQSLSIADVNLVVLASGGANAPAPVPSTAPTIGDDVLTGTPSADSISGLEGADWVNGDEGDDTLSGGFGNDTLSGGAGDDILNGDAGGDSLSGEAGDDQLFGGEGGDTLHGGQGDDRLDGGAGNDALTGGEGSDTYVFGRGSGNDTLNNYAESEYWRSTQGIPGTSTDTVEMTGLRLSDVGFRRENDDLIVYLKDSPDSLRIQHHFATVNSFYPFAVQRFSFADGVDVGFDYVTQATEVTGAEDDVIWGRHGSDQISGGEGADSINGGSGDDLLDGGAGNDSIEGGAGQDTLSGGSGNDYLVGGADDDFLYGGEGADTIYGSAGNDRIDGGSGDDGLQGGQGSDTYVFGRGYGRDTIYNYSTEEYWSPPSINSVDTVELIGLLPSDIIFGRDGDALLVSIKDSPDSLRILHFFYGDAVEQRSHFYIDKFTFADGSVVGLDFVKQAVQQPSENDDLIFGYASNETLHGAGGGDVIHAEGGDDTLIGGEGDDYLHGGTGSNTYVFGLGDGRDKIAARPVSAENPIFARGTLAFKPGIGPRDVSAHRIGTSLEVRVANSGDRITIEGFFQEGSPLNAANPVQLITFADGTKWDLVEMFAPRVDRSFFDESGRLTGHLDSSGFLTHNTYDGLGRLVKTTTFATRALGNPDVWETARLEDLLPPASASDKSTVYLFNAKNQKVAEIDAEGYLSENVFDLAGNVRQTVRYASRLEDSAIATVLASLTLEAGAGTLLSTIRPTAAAQDQVRTFEYDALHRLKKETGIDGSVSETFYDLAGNVVQSIKAQGTSESRSILAKFDLLGRLTGELSPAGAALVNGNLTDVEIDAVWAEHGISHQYDAAGLRVRTTSKVGSIHYLYDADGRIAVEVNALGEVKESSYDVFGQRVRLTAYAQRVDTAQLVGGLLSSPANAGTVAALATAKAASSANSVTQYEYDAAGRLTKTIDAEGVIVTHIYNAFGEEVERISGIAAGRDLHELMTYDLRGQRITTQLDPSGANVVSVNAYDAFGRLIRSVDGNGNERTRTYDRLGRIITQTEPQGMGGNAAVVLSSSYDAFGRVLSQTDGLGHTTQYSYNDAARSVTVTTPEGITVTTARNAFGQTSSVTDGRGNTTSYQYDLNGNLVQTSTALGQSNNTYDAANRLIEAQDANGNRVSYSYDAANRLLSRTVDPQGLALTTQYVYDAKGQQISVIDPNSNRTDIEYDRKGQVLSRTVDPEGLALRTSYAHDGRGNVVNVTQPDGSTTQYNYDALGRREREIVDPNGLALVKTYQYDGNGNVISSVDANGHTTRYVYDAQDQLVYTIDPLGQVQSQVYDAAGRVVQVRQHAGTVGLGLMAGVPTVAQIQALLGTNAQDRVEYRQYDRDNRLLSTVNGLGEVTTYSYDNNGNVLQQRRHAQRIDFATWSPGTTPAVGIDPLHDQLAEHVFDAANRLVSTRNALGESTTFVYDNVGNLLSKAIGGYSETYRYDAAYRLTLAIDAVGAAKQFEYDAGGRITKETRYANLSNAAVNEGIPLEVSARDQVLRYAYDTAGRQRFVVSGSGAVTESRFDARGQVVQQTKYLQRVALPGILSEQAVAAAITTDANDRTEHFAYDAAGRQRFAIDGNGAVSETVYDAQGNVIQRIRRANQAFAPGAVTPSAQDRIQFYAYDAAGRQTSQVDELGGFVAFSYDAKGNLVRRHEYATRVTPPIGAWSAAMLPVASEHDRVLVQTYDAENRAVFSIDAAGAVTRQEYDAFGLLRVRTAYANTLSASVVSALQPTTGFAQFLQLVPPSDDDRTTLDSYDAAGRLRVSVDAAGYLTSREYDGVGRLIKVTQHSQPVTQIPSSSTAQEIFNTLPVEHSTDQIVSYGLDALGRLLSMQRNGTSMEVNTYDGLGNLLLRADANGAERTFDYDSDGNLIAQWDPEVTVGSVVLDANGNLHQGPAVTDRPLTRFTYDGAGQLTHKLEAAGRPEARTTEYAYDAAGHRTKTTLPPVAVMDAAAMAQLLGSGASSATRNEQLLTLTTQTVYNAFGEAVVLVDTAGVATHRAYDQRGQLRFEVDALGYLTENTYDRFGNISAVIRYAEPHGVVETGQTVSASALAESAAALQSSKDRVVETAYDQRNRVISVTQSAVWANDGVTGSGRMERPVTKYVYDTFGQKTQERQLLNEGSDSWVIQHFDYDIRGNQVRSLDALGYVTSREFDAFGNVIAVTEYAEPWDEQAGTLPAINERDRTTRYTYDAHNRKTSETRVNVQYSVASDGTVTTSGLTTTYTYDAVGNLLSTTDPLDHTSQTTYDALGRVTSTSGAQAASVSFVRDAVGNVIALNQGDRVTLTMYDSHGRAIQIAKADSVNEFRSYDARGLLGRSWQSVGSEESGTQVLFTAYQYDALGRRTHVISPASSSALSVSNAALAVQQSAGMVVQDLEYNAFGEVISKGTNGYAEREKYAYDNAGRLVHSYASRGQDSDAGGIWQFQLYDLLGRQTASIASDGSTYLSGALDSAAMDAMGHSGVRRTDFVLDALGRTIEARLAQRQDAVTQQSGQPVIHQTFDRWGNLLSQSDPRSSAWVTRYQYNAFNQIVRQEQPEVGTLDAIGNAFSVTPTKHFYYDAAGREVAQRDANGNLTGKTLDAYGRILEERHADGGVVRYSYNAFDQRVSVTDAMGHTTTYGYDQAGRQTLIITSPVETHEASGADIVSQGSIQLVTRMVYDQAGRMISKTNGADEKETYRYDARGNIIATTRPLGEVTQAAYDSQGRQVAYQNANGDTVISNVDYFGRLNSRTDLAGVATQFDRDFAGQVVSQVSGRGQNLAYQYDAAGNLLHITDAGTNKQSHYAYDAAGARIFEQTVQNGTTLQQQTLAYDSHGRLALIEAMDGVRITRDYDAQGNVLRQQVQSGVPLPSTTEGLQLTEVGKAWTQVGTKTVPVLDPVTGKPKIDPATGQVITRQEPVYGWKPFKELRNQITTEEGTRSTQTQWFAYDSMNRQILVDGAVNGNAQDQANLTADQGHILTYDLNGNRTSDTHFGRQVVQADRQYARDENGNILLDANGNPQYGYTSDRENEGAGNTGGSPASAQALGSSYFKAQLGAVTQTYTYDAANRLKTVSHQTVDEQGQASGNTYLLDTRQYDAAGRLVQSGPAGGLDAGFVTALTGEELNASGLVTKKSFYDDNGRLVQQKVLKADGSRSYDVYYDSLDAEGNVLQYRVVDENDVTQTYTKTYEKRDSYLEASIHGVRSDNEERPSDSTSSYDVNGHLTQVSETDWPEDDAEAQSPGANLERQFETDANGIVLRKTQEGHILKQLIVSGQVMTAYGKGTDPAKQLTDDGKPNYIAQGEFGATYEGIDNRYNSGASSYTVQSGDTLAGIARTLWGDASLWWKLADVNGLAAQGPDSRLAEGQSLSIPGHVSGVHNNAQTHKPYDPTEVVGDTTPNMPAPPVDEGGGCGILGKIIMIVVAVAVTAVTGGAGGAVSNFWGGLLGQGSAAAAAATGATAAAAGSVASQAVGVAIGAQSKFSWKNVALAAVSGGVSGGLGTVDFTGSGELGSLGNTVIRSALGNTISQGIGVATGLQKSFDWKSVAGAAVGAGVGWGVGQALGSNANTLAGASLRSFAAGTATALVRGGKISITQVAVDAFGSALGDGLGDTLRAGLGQSQSQENSPQFMEGSAGGGGNGSYQPDNGPDWGGMGTGTGRWTAEPAGQPTLTAGDFARMDRASEEVWAAQGGAWEQRPGTAATDRAFLEAFQNPMAPVGEGVLMAAGPGYSGGLELRDRLTLRSREDNSLFEEASALAANALQADNRRAAWVQTQAQAASAQYAQGYGNVRDTSPAAGLMVNPETGLADFRYTSQALNSQADGAYRPQIGGSDGITGPSIGSLSANSGTGSYDNPRAWIGNEVIVRERAESMLPEDLRRFELEQRNSFEPNHAMPLMDTARPYASMTALTEAGILDSRAGQALQGAGKLALDTWTALPQLGLGAIALAGDGVGYARAAIAPQRSVLTGQAFPYQPQSKLLQSIESQGVLGTIGGAITGTVRSAPGIGLIGALGTPNRDWQNIGAQAAGSVGFAAVGALRGVRGGVEGANTVGEIGPAARIHPEYWASVSGEVNLQSSIRALRANGSPEALATAKLIKRGDVEVAFKGTDPYGQGAWGRKPWSSNTVEIYLDQVTNPTQSAGIIAHETKHVLQRTTPSTHLKDHEVEAYLWQRAADVNYRKRSSVDSIIQYVDQDPDGLYKAYPWAPNSPWRP
jgi:YD repeat-containing protein